MTRTNVVSEQVATMMTTWSDSYEYDSAGNYMVVTHAFPYEGTEGTEETWAEFALVYYDDDASEFVVQPLTVEKRGHEMDEQLGERRGQDLVSLLTDLEPQWGDQWGGVTDF
jgi:hypothetical protein